MPSKRKKTEAAGNGREFFIPPELLDQVVKGPMTQSEVEAVCRALKKAVIERAMGAEMSQYPGYEPGVKPDWPAKPTTATVRAARPF